MNKKSLVTICLLLVLPITVRANNFIPDQSLPQGDTIQLLVPKLDFTKATGTFDGKTFPFYEINRPTDPTAPITRAEFVQLIYLNHPEVQSTTANPNTQEIVSQKSFLPFPDVSVESKFFPAIQFATEKGIISGYEDGLFHPYDAVTRGQAAKIIINAFHPDETITEVPFFPDLPADYSLREQVYQAVRAGIFKGYPDGKMLPNRSINFLEANLIIKRASGLETPFTINERPLYRAFLGIHRLSDLGEKNLSIELTDQSGKITNENSIITVTKQYFISQHFKLAEDREELFGKDYQDQTWELINAAKSDPHPKQMWEGAFIVPTTGEVTLGFGDKLYINGKYAGSHFGIDYANREGTPVYAANSGLVTMASDTPAYGKTIVIDHGENVFTMYIHLAELKVKPGDLINKGDLIALMGSTGLSTGPHLHFTQFIGDIVVSSTPWFKGKY